MKKLRNLSIMNHHMKCVHKWLTIFQMSGSRCMFFSCLRVWAKLLLFLICPYVPQWHFSSVNYCLLLCWLHHVFFPDPLDESSQWGVREKFTILLWHLLNFGFNLISRTPLSHFYTHTHAFTHSLCHTYSLTHLQKPLKVHSKPGKK